MSYICRLFITALLGLFLTACASTSDESVSSEPVTDNTPTSTNNSGTAVDPSLNNAFGTGLSLQRLSDLGIDTVHADAPLLEVWNKIDLLDDEAHEFAGLAGMRKERKPVFVSAVTGAGIDALIAEIDARLGINDEVLTVTLSSGEGSKLNWLYENADILNRQTSDDGTVTCRVRISAEKRGRLAGLLA